MRPVWLSIVCVLLMSAGVFAREPWKLEEALGAPDWLSMWGETRWRYEEQNGRFRAERTGNDRLLAIRNLLTVEANSGPFSLGFELQDSRTYLDSADSPNTNSFTNPLDFLQLYARVKTKDFLYPGIDAMLTVGRQIPSIGSKRQIERIDFANVIKSYSGAYLQTKSKRGDELHAFYGVLVGREPTDLALLDRNALRADKEQWGRKFWLAHYRRPNILPGLVSDLWGELFVYGLFETDKPGVQTPNRQYVWPGFRLYRGKAKGRWDADAEIAWRFGSRRATSDPNDTRDLDSSSSMVFLKAGYTLESDLNLNIAMQYYRTSGDKDPNDDNYDQFERLFGGRRGDLNNTSIHGPLTPANLTAIGPRFEVKPNDRMDARLTYSATYLTSATDAWVVARLRDPTGQSGNFIGHAIDGRARYWIVPGNLQLEVGASALIFGGFANNVPNGPTRSRSLFGYTQLTVFF